MILRQCKELLLATAISLAIVPASVAHVIWFPSDQGGYNLWLSEFEDSASLVYDTAGLIDIKAIDPFGNVIPSSVSSTSSPIAINPSLNPAALTAIYDRGLWIRDDSVGIDVDHEADHYLGYLTSSQLADLGYDNSNIVHHLKYTKALYQWTNALGQAFGQKFGQTLEILPLINPFSLKAGDLFPVQVLFQGNAVSDATVLYLDQEVPVDANGIFNISIGSDGLQPIEADFSTEATADRPLTYYVASFSAHAVPEPSSVLGILGLGGLMLMINRRSR